MIDKGVQILPVSVHEMVPMCAFRFYRNDQKLPFDPHDGFISIAKKTEQNTLLVF